MNGAVRVRSLEVIGERELRGLCDVLIDCRLGVGAALLAAAEAQALKIGRTLLVLDTVTGGDAERLYARQGWQRCGEIPRYALFPAGGYCSTTVFYKSLA